MVSDQQKFRYCIVRIFWLSDVKISYLLYWIHKWSSPSWIPYIIDCLPCHPIYSASHTTGVSIPLFLIGNFGHESCPNTTLVHRGFSTNNNDFAEYVLSSVNNFLCSVVSLNCLNKTYEYNNEVQQRWNAYRIYFCFEKYPRNIRDWMNLYEIK